jgi:hypothetical protein
MDARPCAMPHVTNIKIMEPIIKPMVPIERRLSGKHNSAHSIMKGKGNSGAGLSMRAAGTKNHAETAPHKANSSTTAMYRNGTGIRGLPTCSTLRRKADDFQSLAGTALSSNLTRKREIWRILPSTSGICHPELRARYAYARPTAIVARSEGSAPQLSGNVTSCVKPSCFVDRRRAVGRECRLEPAG